MLVGVRRATLAVALLVSLAACSNNGKSNGAGSSEAATAGPTAAATPDCHGESPVWASERRKTYVLPGNARYGTGKTGSYMCLSDAQSRGYRENRGRGRHHRHRQNPLNP